RTVALHPAPARGGKPVELLSEVLDHVRPLELPVHQHVDAESLLAADACLDLGLEPGLVGTGVDLPGAPAVSQLAYLRRLRERADGGGGQQRQVEGVALNG